MGSDHFLPEDVMGKKKKPGPGPTHTLDLEKAVASQRAQTKRSRDGPVEPHSIYSTARAG